MARSVLMIGFGSTIRSDDALGPQLVGRLRELDADLDADIDIISAHQLDFDMAEAVQAHDVVLFVDASREGTAGEVRCHRVTCDPAGAVLAHHLTPQALLTLVRQLWGSAPEAWLITVTGHSFALGDRLSPRLEVRLPLLASTVLSAGMGLRQG
ncbi:MAG TPA: hydrogenase maturation protease [Thermoanaerobaculia bacterium]